MNIVRVEQKKNQLSRFTLTLYFPCGVSKECRRRQMPGKQPLRRQAPLVWTVKEAKRWIWRDSFAKIDIFPNVLKPSPYVVGSGVASPKIWRGPKNLGGPICLILGE